ncbi:MAG: hypothetical protein Cons2KO_34920 [Congregibacter sp.]
MQQIFSAQMADFAAIYEDDVELVSVKPATHDHAIDKALAVLLRHGGFSAQWSQGVNDTIKADEVLSSKVSDMACRALADEINAVADMLGLLLGCEAIGVRLATLNAPMCPRFHVDKVPCRFLLTLSGKGTEWIPHKDVDWAWFADRTSVIDPLLPGAASYVLPTGNWSLLKGGAWKDGFDGVVHRSPEGADTRLFLSIDPLFSSSEEGSQG